jgi:uncharacterized membrane protein YcaP (DUF421 family)
MNLFSFIILYTLYNITTKTIYIKIDSFHSLYSLCNNFLLQFILSYSRYVRTSLYRVLEAREKLDTGDENILIFGMGK